MNTSDQDTQHLADIRYLVTFRLDQKTYALPIEPIVQIIEMVTITPLPKAVNSMEGVINVRGAAVPVINLRRHLDLAETKLQLHTPIILVQTAEWLVGLVVDQVTDVLSISADQIIHPTDVLPTGVGDVPLLQGLMHTATGAVLLLDLEFILAAEHAKLVEAVTALSAIGDLSVNSQEGPTESERADEFVEVEA